MTNSTTTVRRSESARRTEGPETLVGFLLALRAAGRSPKTEQKYRESVLLLADFAAKMGMPPVEQLTAEHLRHYFKSLYDKGNRPGTVATRYRSLQAFYKWLVEEGELRESPIARIKPPKLEERVMPHYAPDDVSRVLLACSGKDILDLRDAAIILTLFDGGMRGSELCELWRDDANLKAMTVHIRKGKGNKERIVGIGYKSAQAIERYLRKREQVNIGNRESSWLFANWYGEKLTFNAIRLMLRKRFEQVGLEFHGAHAFRRGFAISFLDSGGAPEDLRVLAGWDSPQMLRRYTKATERERALKGHRQHSPADRLR